MIQKSYIPNSPSPIARVTFSLPGSIWADQINLVGDFNQWNLSSHPFARDREGCWVLTVDLEPGRRYQFRYLLDKRDWNSDNQADDYVPTSDGVDNFVVATEPPLALDYGRRTSQNGAYV